MTERTSSCGSATVHYDDGCTYMCTCVKDVCLWTVTCGKHTVSGFGKPRLGIGTAPGPGEAITVDGPRGRIARLLRERWGVRVVVPRGTGRERVSTALRGTREETAAALGLRLGPSHSGGQ